MHDEAQERLKKSNETILEKDIEIVEGKASIVKLQELLEKIEFRNSLEE